MLLHKLKLYGISGQEFNFILLFLFSVIKGFKEFCMGSLHKIMQLMFVFLKAPSFALHFPTIHNNLPEDVICNIAVYADDFTLYSKCDLASDLWHQLA